MSGSPLIARVLRWLRVGYPDGVPREDFPAVLGVLHRDLTDQEIEYAAQALAVTGQGMDPDEIRQMVRDQVHEEASADDVERIREAVAAHDAASQADVDGGPGTGVQGPP